MISCAYQSPIGTLTLIACEDALAGLYFENHKVGGPPAEARAGSCAIADLARRQLDAYFAGRRHTFDLPLSLDGTPFQQRVWRALAEIPFGQTRSYGAIAAQAGAPAAVRAVGAAVGRNRVSIVIPCHRVVGKDGNLTGFAGGLVRKSFLLSLERNPAAIAC